MLTKTYCLEFVVCFTSSHTKIAKSFVDGALRYENLTNRFPF